MDCCPKFEYQTREKFDASVHFNLSKLREMKCNSSNLFPKTVRHFLGKGATAPSKHESGAVIRGISGIAA